MTQKVKKAVIPAAGLGTRFLPATKAVPKELLPVVDVPSIQLIVQEVVAAGIETVVFITSRGKDSILDHFDISPELQEKLEADGKSDLASKLRETSEMVEVVSVRQGVPRGLGHAVLCAQHIVGDEPFVVLLGDDLVDSEIPCTTQMIEVFEQHEKSVVALMEVADHDVSKFGICAGEPVSDRVTKLTTMVEKPALEKAPSNTAIVGRYVLTPRIFEFLKSTDPGAGGEIQLTDAMAALMQAEGIMGYEFKGRRYDAGDQFGYLQANIAYALKRPEIRERLLEYMKQLVSES